jgi:predicted acetyltransferase
MFGHAGAKIKPGERAAEYAREPILYLLLRAQRCTSLSSVASACV